MMNRPKLLGLLAVTLVACHEPARCVEASRTVVTDSNAPLLIGGTYGDALATVVGERAGTLRWLESEPYVSGFPPPGETRITVTIDEPTIAWDVDLERRGGRRNERLASCLDQLKTELEVELQSDDGMLDTAVVTAVSFQSPEAVTIIADVTDEELGTLEFHPVDEDASLLLMLSYGSLTGPEGALELHSRASDGSGNGVGMSVDLATWTLQ
jgi:hypothetical protein